MSESNGETPTGLGGPSDIPTATITVVSNTVVAPPRVSGKRSREDREQQADEEDLASSSESAPGSPSLKRQAVEPESSPPLPPPSPPPQEEMMVVESPPPPPSPIPQSQPQPQVSSNLFSTSNKSSSQVPQAASNMFAYNPFLSAPSLPPPQASTPRVSGKRSREDHEQQADEEGLASSSESAPAKRRAVEPPSQPQASSRVQLIPATVIVARENQVCQEDQGQAEEEDEEEDEVIVASSSRPTQQQQGGGEGGGGKEAKKPVAQQLKPLAIEFLDTARIALQLNAGADAKRAMSREQEEIAQKIVDLAPTERKRNAMKLATHALEQQEQDFAHRANAMAKMDDMLDIIYRLSEGQTVEPSLIQEAVTEFNHADEELEQMKDGNLLEYLRGTEENPGPVRIARILSEHLVAHVENPLPAGDLKDIVGENMARVGKYTADNAETLAKIEQMPYILRPDNERKENKSSSLAPRPRRKTKYRTPAGVTGKAFVDGQHKRLLEVASRTPIQNPKNAAERNYNLDIYEARAALQKDQRTNGTVIDPTDFTPFFVAHDANARERYKKEIEMIINGDLIYTRPNDEKDTRLDFKYDYNDTDWLVNWIMFFLQHNGRNEDLVTVRGVVTTKSLAEMIFEALIFSFTEWQVISHERFLIALNLALISYRYSEYVEIIRKGERRREPLDKSVFDQMFSDTEWVRYSKFLADHTRGTFVMVIFMLVRDICRNLSESVADGVAGELAIMTLGSVLRKITGNIVVRRKPQKIARVVRVAEDVSMADEETVGGAEAADEEEQAAEEDVVVVVVNDDEEADDKDEDDEGDDEEDDKDEKKEDEDDEDDVVVSETVESGQADEEDQNMTPIQQAINDVQNVVKQDSSWTEQDIVYVSRVADLLGRPPNILWLELAWHAMKRYNTESNSINKGKRSGISELTSEQAKLVKDEKEEDVQAEEEDVADAEDISQENAEDKKDALETQIENARHDDDDDDDDDDYSPDGDAAASDESGSDDDDDDDMAKEEEVDEKEVDPNDIIKKRRQPTKPATPVAKPGARLHLLSRLVRTQTNRTRQPAKKRAEGVQISEASTSSSVVIRDPYRLVTGATFKQIKDTNLSEILDKISTGITVSPHTLKDLITVYIESESTLSKSLEKSAVASSLNSAASANGALLFALTLFYFAKANKIAPREMFGATDQEQTQKTIDILRLAFLLLVQMRRQAAVKTMNDAWEMRYEAEYETEAGKTARSDLEKADLSDGVKGKIDRLLADVKEEDREKVKATIVTNIKTVRSNIFFFLGKIAKRNSLAVSAYAAYLDMIFGSDRRQFLLAQGFPVEMESVINKAIARAYGKGNYFDQIARYSVFNNLDVVLSNIKENMNKPNNPMSLQAVFKETASQSTVKIMLQNGVSQVKLNLNSAKAIRLAQAIAVHAFGDLGADNKSMSGVVENVFGSEDATDILNRLRQ